MVLWDGAFGNWITMRSPIKGVAHSEGARRPSTPPWGHGRASRCEAASKDIIAGVEVLTIPEWFAGGGGVLVGESGAVSIIEALDAAGFVIVSKEALKAGSDGYA